MHHTTWLCTRPLMCYGKAVVALVGLCTILWSLERVTAAG